MNVERARTMPSTSFHYDIGNEFEKFLNNPHLHDIVVCCGETTYYAHKDILRSRSEFLDALFRSPHFHAQEDELGLAVINLTNDENAVFQVLKYIYTDKVAPSDVLLVPEMALLARTLQLSGLLQRLKRRYGALANGSQCSERDERCEPEQGQCMVVEGGEQQTFVLHRHRPPAFLEPSRLEGRVEVVLGPYRFRRQSGVLLAARSEYFASRITHSECVVEVSGVPPEKLALMLRWVRMEGDAELQNMETCLQMLHHSIDLRLCSLQAYCEHVIHTSFLSIQSVCPVWNSTAQSEFLSEQCLKFVQEKFVDVAHTDSFLELRKELLHQALIAGRINAATPHMLQALRRWSKANCDGGRHDGSDDRVDRLLHSFLPPRTMFNLLNRRRLLGLPTPNKPSAPIRP